MVAKADILLVKAQRKCDEESILITNSLFPVGNTRVGQQQPKSACVERLPRIAETNSLSKEIYFVEGISLDLKYP